MKKLIVLVAVILMAGCYSTDPETTGKEGKTVPSFRILEPDSTTYFNTEKIPEGKSFALFFFGPYCPYSRGQMEEIIEDMDKLKDIHFYVFTQAPFNEMKEFYNTYHLDKYPNVTAGYDFTNFFADYFEVEGVPYMAIYGKDKKLRKAFKGKIYGKQILRTAED